MVWVKFILFLCLFSTVVYSLELTEEEINYFKIIDLNNDGFLSTEEINQTTNIIFQLIDSNKDNKISLLELEELKNIIEIIK